jgi:hypothetical protein
MVRVYVGESFCSAANVDSGRTDSAAVSRATDVRKVNAVSAVINLYVFVSGVSEALKVEA